MRALRLIVATLVHAVAILLAIAGSVLTVFGVVFVLAACRMVDAAAKWGGPRAKERDDAFVAELADALAKPTPPCAPARAEPPSGSPQWFEGRFGPN